MGKNRSGNLPLIFKLLMSDDFFSDLYCCTLHAFTRFHSYLGILHTVVQYFIEKKLNQLCAYSTLTVLHNTHIKKSQ